MAGLNQVQLIGRLTRDPEIKNANGTNIANFTVATSKSWKDDSGAKQERSEFHNCVAFRKTADLIGEYLVKGAQCYVQGELQTRSWDDKDTGAKKYKTEIVVQNVQFLDSKKQTEEAKAAPGIQPPQQNYEETMTF